MNSPGSFRQSFKKNPFDVHICEEMKQHDIERAKNTGYKREFSIRFDPVTAKWTLFSRYSPMMSVVQCPFCCKTMFSGNQVTIE